MTSRAQTRKQIVGTVSTPTVWTADNDLLMRDAVFSSINAGLEYRTRSTLRGGSLSLAVIVSIFVGLYTLVGVYGLLVLGATGNIPHILGCLVLIGSFWLLHLVTRLIIRDYNRY